MSSCQTEDQTETWLDGDILHSTTRPPESGSTATALPTEMYYITRMIQQVDAVSEATTNYWLWCAKLDQAIQHRVRFTQLLACRLTLDRAEIG